MRVRTVVAAFAAIVVLGAVAADAMAWRPAIAPMPAPSGFDPALVARGAQLAAIGDCGVCHTGPGGAAYVGGAPVRTPFGEVYATNITPDPDTGIGRWSEAAFRRAMQDGVDRGGGFLYPAFPYNHYTHATDADVAAIYAFLMTRQPVHAVTPATRLPFPLNIRPLMAGWNLLFLDHDPVAPHPAKDAAWNRGAYLVEGLGHCQACHTPHNALGAEESGRAFTGGQADGWEGPGLTAASSPAAIAWDADAIYRFLRHGLDDRHAAAAGPMGPVSHDLSGVPEADVRAMAAYVAGMTGPPDPARAQQVAARVAAAQTPPAALAGTEGAAIFAGACAGCHGGGAPMMQLAGRPSLALGSSTTMPTARNAAQVVLNGLQPADGEAGPWMPGFAGSLTDTQVAAVLDYMRARYTDQPAWTGTAATIHQIREGRSS